MMKKTVYAVVGLMVAPIVFSLLGGILAWVFSCTGGMEISKCSFPPANGIVGGLVGMGFLFMITLPLGAMALGGIFVLWVLKELFVGKEVPHSSHSASPINKATADDATK